MTSFTFVPYQTKIASEFWQLLSQRKIDKDKLDNHDNFITATIDVATASTAPRLDLTQASFDTERVSVLSEYRSSGFVRNTNTIEEFKAVDKNAFLHDTASQTWDHIVSGKATTDPSLLNNFALLCFSDLKKYAYTYWMAHPALPSSWRYKSRELASQDLQEAVRKWRLIQNESQANHWVIDARNQSVHTLCAWDKIPSTDRIFGFLDTSSNDALSWAARNFLTLFTSGLKLQTINFLAYRGARSPSLLFMDCTIMEPVTAMPKPVGWERNNAGQLAPRLANLGSSMDPRLLADDAVDLNLKLMKWRIAPELDLQRIKSCRCLLLGAGTLGCYVSRLLLGWGVHKITFVDSARVSYSNPVRQPLFKFQDCKDGGVPKAAQAAEALKEVYPGVDATGYALNVPMIGHPFTSLDAGKADYDQLEGLVDAHDAIFLLMDSRESRWLPTVMGYAKGKIVINAALGFDSYVVLRHGTDVNPATHPLSPLDTRPQSTTTTTMTTTTTTTIAQLGCYFCNDVVAPMNSLADRSLDQMCTVTRPGLAALASGTAVELLVSLLQHPLGIHAPSQARVSASHRAQQEAASGPGESHGPSSPVGAENGGGGGAVEGVLGLVPHTVRGYLRTFTTQLLHGERYAHCSACSPSIIAAYRNASPSSAPSASADTNTSSGAGLGPEPGTGSGTRASVDVVEEDGIGTEPGGWDFVRTAISVRGTVERVSGLADVQRRVDEMDLAEWSESEPEPDSELDLAPSSVPVPVSASVSDQDEIEGFVSL